MSKKDFLKKLSKELEALPRDERDKTLAYYDEQIEDRKEAGATEEAAVDAMGDIRAIAGDIIQDARERGVEFKRRGMPVGAKIAMILAAVFVGVALIGGIVWAAFVAVGFTTAGEFRQVEKDFSVYDNGAIEVDFSQYDLYLGQSSDGRVHVTYFENDDLITFTITETEYGIKLVQRQKWFAWLFFNKGNRRAEILIPESFKGSVISSIATGDARIDRLVSPTVLKISGSTGDIVVNDASAVKASFVATTGDVAISRCSFTEELTVKCSTGDIAIGKTSAKKMYVKVTTGDILVDTAASLEFEAQGSTGDIRLISVTAGQVKVHLTTGQIALNGLNADTIEAQSTTGAITGTLAGDINDYTIESHVSTGRNSLPESFGNGPKSLKVRATTGDISISFGG